MGDSLSGTQRRRLSCAPLGLRCLSRCARRSSLELRNSSSSLIASNDNWRSDQEAEIIATTIPPSNDLESAIVATLPANNSAYTAIVQGVNNGTGIGVVEAYDLDRTVDSKLANISTRGFVQTGDNVMIGGLIVLGQIARVMYVYRPIAAQSGRLGDPTLERHDGMAPHRLQ